MAIYPAPSETTLTPEEQASLAHVSNLIANKKLQHALAYFNKNKASISAKLTECITFKLDCYYTCCN